MAEKEKSSIDLLGENTGVNPIGGVNPNSHGYEIQQLKTDITENIRMLKRETLESLKLSQNMKFIVYDLADKIIWRIGENTLHDPYDFIIAIKAIAHEFHDDNIVEIARKIKNDILVLDNLLH
jgi:hypothetical protein